MKFDDTDPDKIRIAKRIAVVTGTFVALIFCGTAYLGYVYFVTERPASEYFSPPSDLADGEREPGAGPDGQTSPR